MKNQKIQKILNSCTKSKNLVQVSVFCTVVFCYVNYMLSCNTPGLAGVCQLFGYYFCSAIKTRYTGSLPAILREFIIKILEQNNYALADDIDLKSNAVLK